MIWAVVPAAGVGKRMQSDRPKQYLPLAGSTVIQHSIERLLSNSRVEGVVVAVAGDDPWWERLEWSDAERIYRVVGGQERSDSVLNALDWLAGQQVEQQAEDDPWVLVHDAARPCLSASDLQGLIETLENDPVGGLLAAPVTDTLKRSGGSPQVVETVDRSTLWRALTPQMFRLKLLREALQQGRAAGTAVTDDAQAIERLGYRPRLVEGAATNLKVTHPGDLRVAEAFLQ